LIETEKRLEYALALGLPRMSGRDGTAVRRNRMRASSEVTDGTASVAGIRADELERAQSLARKAIAAATHADTQATAREAQAARSESAQMLLEERIQQLLREAKGRAADHER